MNLFELKNVFGFRFYNFRQIVFLRITNSIRKSSNQLEPDFSHENNDERASQSVHAPRIR